MKNIRLTIEYDGTNYFGWQNQRHGKTIEGELEKALYRATGERVKLIGSGRTDKGVHALGQVANFYTSSTIPGDKYKILMDYLLPEDITIVDSEEVEMDFHSRYDSKGKFYKYRVFNRPKRSSIYRNYSYHVAKDLDIDKIEEAMEYLIGEQDFTAFKVRRTPVHTGVRIIEEAYVERNDEFVDFYFKGKGFMHNMIRIIVGTLILVGLGEKEASYLKEVIESKNREEAGKTVSPNGLYLLKVFY